MNNEPSFKSLVGRKVGRPIALFVYKFSTFFWSLSIVLGKFSRYIYLTYPPKQKLSVVLVNQYLNRLIEHFDSEELYSKARQYAELVAHGFDPEHAFRMITGQTNESTIND